MSQSLLSLKYTRGSLEVIDQLLLPDTLVFLPIKDCNDAWAVIRSMQVRGAPLIAIVAMLALAVEAQNLIIASGKEAKFDDLCVYFLERLEYLRSSRPTAVNLFIAADEFTELIAKHKAQAGSKTATGLLTAIIEAAELMLELDVATNKAIGMHGALRILELVQTEKVRVLTVCNTGSLATAGYGTALGVVRALNDMGKLGHVYACETRPYNQGARLTAFEIVEDKLPGTLICDNMASALMAVKGVDCVVVGADRVASNGDTANKIGTYQLAIAAKYHGIPFFSAVPTTTLDLSMASGAEIHVEERPASELTTMFGRNIAPVGINAWNPGFDVTPCSLIKGIITEIGVIECQGDIEGVIPVAAYIKQHSKRADLLEKAEKSPPVNYVPPGYKRMSEKDIELYVAQHDKLAKVLDIPCSADSIKHLKITEVGDGNLNFVYIVEGRGGKKLVVKQALPWVRCVGEAWPLSLTRAGFEAGALRAEAAYTSTDAVPEVYVFDRSLCMIVMRFVEAPHIILRKALMEGLKFSTFAADIGSFMASTLFKSSGLALEGGDLRRKIAHWSENSCMCSLTEQVIFTDPYTESQYNKWTSPQLDAYALGIKVDTSLKMAAAYHKEMFLTKTQALIHGDLHTGSVMAMEGSTFMIDPEFAFYGPMGFDIGAVMANMFLNYFANAARFPDGAFGEWVLAQIVIIYETFVEDFLAFWDAESGVGDIFKKSVYQGPVFKRAQTEYLESIWRDSLGFAGMKMLRRIVGIAHVEDLDGIEDADKRSLCEKRALRFAQQLIMGSYNNSFTSQGLGTIKDVIMKLAIPLNNSVPSAAW